MIKKPVKIAGGGISGLTCAISLARAGVPVEIYERKTAVGGRFWGDLQGLENWTSKNDVLQELEELNLGIHLPSYPLPPLYLIDGKKLELSFSQQRRPLCYLVKRGTASDSLDQTLFRAAVNAGVKFHFSQALNIDMADIVATGPRTKELFAIDIGMQFRTTHPDIAVALVNDEAAYKGYAYLLIVNGYGCICTVMFDKFNQIHQHFDKSLEILNNYLSFDIIDPKRIGGMGSFSNDLCFEKGKRYYVGEAAGLQDLLWGFGIRSAILSGALAAQCLMDGRNYRSEAEALFSQRLRSGIVVRYLFEKISSLHNGYALMGKLVNRQADPMYFLRKAYGYTPLHRLVMPFAIRSMRKRYPALHI